MTSSPSKDAIKLPPIRRLPLVFASVGSSGVVEDSCKQHREIRNGQNIRDRSPGEGTPGTKVAKKDGQHLLGIGCQEKSLKIHDELEDIQESTLSIKEEYDHTFRVLLLHTYNDTGNLKQDETVNYVSSLSASDVIIATDYAYLERIIGDGQAHILRRHLLPAGINQIWVRSGGLLVVEA
ncbi:hypothetical protein BHYA_0031g00070 [Botrytis hyacinthi]|uniref:Uncharacterized protein n=1 Tax=Botrytis hyacinthi TaxID=278943 RepID=A0A4Z1GVZ1_9HELO|nr:hypothetical protein BHYA_0031g00070 [Botrytis hyacinthi]